MKDTIVVKKVDKSVYARLKSIAVLRGITVGEALTEAMKLWLLLNEPSSKDYLEYVIARIKSEEKLKELYGNLKEWRGEYVVVCDGRVIGFYDKLREARSTALKTHAKQCIVAKRDEVLEEKRIEFGMGVFS